MLNGIKQRNIFGFLLGFVFAWAVSSYAATGTYSINGVIPGGAGGSNALAASVATNETTSSTTYTDLATVGPSVTLTTGTSVIVWIQTTMYRTTSGNSAYISVAVSGATTSAATDARSTNATEFGANGALSISTVVYITGLTPGSNTFTMKYKIDGGAAYNYYNRNIAVLAL